MFELDNKIAVVIGGAGGFGSACARSMAIQNARIIIADLDLDRLNSVAKSIEDETGKEVLPIQVDVASEESVTAMRDKVIQTYSTVDILVNAQGINIKQPSVEIDSSAWDSMFDH